MSEERCSNAFDGRGARCAPESDSASPTRPAGWCACRGTQHVSSCSQMSRHTSGRESGGRRGQRPRNRNHERKSRRAPQRPRAIRKHSLRTLPRSLAVTSTRGQPDEDPRRARRIQPAPQLLSGVCVCHVRTPACAFDHPLSLWSTGPCFCRPAGEVSLRYLPKRGSSGCASGSRQRKGRRRVPAAGGALSSRGENSAWRGRLARSWARVRACVRACVRE